MTDENKNNGSGAHERQEAEYEGRQPLDGAQSQSGQAPEPPLDWNNPYQDQQFSPQGQWQNGPDAHPETRIAEVRGQRHQLDGSDIALFESGRKFLTAAQVCAIISLFIGGMLLSAVSIVLAVVGSRKFNQISANGCSPEFAMQLKRSGTVAIVMCVIALALNVVSFIALYPLVMEMMQSGDLAAMFGMQPHAAVSGGSTWG